MEWLVIGIAAGWSDGYNAAMNRECVWTWKGTDHYRSGCGWIQPFITKFCNTCGGKVSSGEEKNDVSKLQ